MQTEAIDYRGRLQPGQLWKLEHGYVHIVEVGKRLVHYKTLRQPTQRAAVTRMISVEALLKYLAYCEGQLVLWPQLSGVSSDLARAFPY
jgi:hypothetical protein